MKARARRAAADGAGARRPRARLGRRGYVGCRKCWAAATGSSTSSSRAFTSGSEHEAADSGGPGADADGACRAVVALAGIGIAVYLLPAKPRGGRRARGALRRRHRCCSNKYYVDEVYDATSCSRFGSSSEDGLWKIVDVSVIDGAVNGVARLGRRRSASCCGGCRPDRCAPTPRRCLLRRAVAIPRAIYLWPVCDDMFPDSHLARRAAARRRGPAAVRARRRAQRHGARDRAGRVGAGVRRDAAAVGAVRRRLPPIFSSSSATPGFRRSASATPSASTASACCCWCSRLPHAARAPRIVGIGAQEDARRSASRAAPRERDDRRVRLARPVPLLRVLGSDADPDVFPHRHLGLRPPHLRGDQVLPVHDGGQRADAARDPRPRVSAQHGDRQLQLRPARRSTR